MEQYSMGRHSNITGQIIQSFYSVYNTLGCGFLEKVYENALVIELRRQGLAVSAQQPISVYYQNQVVGEYIADVVVEDCVIVELKAVKKLAEEHEAQLLNYLKATRYEVGLLLNFGEKAEVDRKIYDNYRKGTLSWTRSGNQSV